MANHWNRAVSCSLYTRTQSTQSCESNKEGIHFLRGSEQGKGRSKRGGRDFFKKVCDDDNEED